MVKIFNTSSGVPTSSVENENIIISGGGLAGLSTSIGLAKLGFHVDIIECRKDWLHRGSAFGLAANGRKALKELFRSDESLDGLLDKGMYFKEHDSYLLMWFMVRDALLEESKKFSTITIHMGKTIESYDDASYDSCIEVVVKDTENTNKKTKLRGSLLIAADGGEIAVLCFCQYFECIYISTLIYAIAYSLLKYA